MIGIAVMLTACASSGARSGAPRGDRNLVTSEEIRESVALNAYDYIQSNRPIWLRRRGQTSILMDGDILVYLDESRLGGPETLRQVSLVAVDRMQFLDASAAQQRFGVGHGHGVILIYSRR